MSSSIICNSKNLIPLFFCNSLCNIQRHALPLITFSRQKKHYNQDFQKEKSGKVLKVFLPNFQDQNSEKLSIKEMRAKLKEKGISPFCNWNEKPLFIGCTNDIFEPYIPPEGDGKISPVTGSGVKQMYEDMGEKSKSYLALRKIHNIDYKFDVPTLADKALELYVEAQKALVSKDEERLQDFVTEKALPEMMENVKNKTLVWNFIQQLEHPRIVQIRIQEMLSKSNTFAQVTVRFHTQQSLAVYDRFGRLLYGSEDVVKDCLEYVVFEKHLSHPYGIWRIHGKIIPEWLPPRDTIKETCFTPQIDT